LLRNSGRAPQTVDKFVWSQCKGNTAPAV